MVTRGCSGGVPADELRDQPGELLRARPRDPVAAVDLDRGQVAAAGLQAASATRGDDAGRAAVRRAGPAIEVRQGSGTSQARTVGAVEVDRRHRRSAAPRAPRAAGARSGRGRRRAGGAAPGRGAQRTRGATAAGRPRRSSCAANCGSIRSRPPQVEVSAGEVVQRRSADRGVRRDPPRRRGSQVSAATHVPRQRPSPSRARRGAPARPSGRVASRTRRGPRRGTRAVVAPVRRPGRPPGPATSYVTTCQSVGQRLDHRLPHAAGRRGSRAAAARWRARRTRHRAR